MGDPASHIHGRGGVYTPNFAAEQTAWCIHRGPPMPFFNHLFFFEGWGAYEGEHVLAALARSAPEFPLRGGRQLPQGFRCQ